MNALKMCLFLALTAGPIQADQVFIEDVVVNGSACIGEDCVSGDATGQANLRLKSSAPELYFEASDLGAPRLDWRMRVAFNTLRISEETNLQTFAFSQFGRFGIGSAFPELDLHIQDGDTPSIRLDQDYTEGNLVQIWDIGANDANFFVRDQTAGTLPFRIRPGAPENALYVAANGEVGMGIPDPQGALHIRRNQPNNVPHLVLQNRRKNGLVEIWMQDENSLLDNDTLRMQLNGDAFNISYNGTGGAEFQVTKSGEVRVLRGDLVVANGGVIVGGQALNVPDYVFADDYELMSLKDVEAFVARHSHLPHIPSAADVQTNGLDMTEMQLALLKTVEEQTLHMLDQADTIEAQARENAAQTETIDALTARMARLEAQLAALLAE